MRSLADTGPYSDSSRLCVHHVSFTISNTNPYSNFHP
jgi:hypothetical protein